MELMTQLGFAFLGGLILNIMPCVFPILTMKVFHLVHHSDAPAHENRMHGLAYTAGTLVAFLGFAIPVILLKNSGAVVAQGMQMQNPSFVAIMTAILLGLGLNSLGVFEIHLGLAGESDSKGYWGSVSSGALAVLVATPCSAPFLGSAVVYALAKGTPAIETVAIFLSVGLGLAFPFLVFSFIPAASRLLPRPGPWMETFKKLMGFTLLAAAVWLFGVLQKQLTPDSANWFLAFLLVLSIGLWALDHFGGLLVSTARRWTVRGLVLVMVMGFGSTVTFERPQAPTARVVLNTNAEKGEDGSVPCPDYQKTTKDKLHWVHYDGPTRDAFLKCGRPIFIDYTATWCVSCQTFKKTHIDIQSVRALLESSQVIPMKADLTGEAEELWEELSTLFDRSGLPVYVVWHPDGHKELLPDGVPPTKLPAALKAAAKKFPPKG